MSNFQTQKKTMLSQIQEYAPRLYEFFGLQENIISHAQNVNTLDTFAIHEERQKVFASVIEKKVTTLFGKDALKNFSVNLTPPFTVNIVDHHQILNHPVLLSSNFISNAHKLLQDQKPNAIVVISSGDPPPNNIFSQNGFQYHGKKVLLFSNSEKEYSSYYLPKREFDPVARLQKAKRWNEFSPEEKKFLEQEQSVLQKYDYSNCHDYCDQMSVIVKEMWPRLFEEKLRPQVPELLYFTQEETVTEILLTLLKQDNNFGSYLFDAQIRETLLNTFRGNVVTWNEAEGKGTHFFWRKHPTEPRILRLYVEGDRLVPADPRYAHLTVPLSRESLQELLEKREIVPSLFTIFWVLNFYMGIKPLLGLGSLVYMNLMKDSWIQFLTQIGESEELERVKTVDLTGLVGAPALSFARENGKIRTLYAYDIIEKGGLSEQYLRHMLEQPFSNLIITALPLIYGYVAQKYIPKEKQVSVTLTSDELAEEVFPWL